MEWDRSPAGRCSALDEAWLSPAQAQIEQPGQLCWYVLTRATGEAQQSKALLEDIHHRVGRQQVMKLPRHLVSIASFSRYWPLLQWKSFLLHHYVYTSHTIPRLYRTLIMASSV